MRPATSNALRPLAAILLVTGVGLAVSRCGHVILTAPQGSTLHMEANPRFIQAQGAVSVISVLVIEPIGTPVPDGTVVQFFTTLGRIDEQGKTNDGVVRVNLVATGLSGVASVTAVSGGEAPPPPASSTSTVATTSTIATTTTTQRPGPNAPQTPPLGINQGVGATSITVAIGSALPNRVVVTSDLPRITAQRPATIVANVLDGNGNPVANVPVFFTLRVQTTTERLDSSGDPVFTDFNGRAEDTLRTTAPAGSASRTVTVDATTANSITGNVVVGVN